MLKTLKARWAKLKKSEGKFFKKHTGHIIRAIGLLVVCAIVLNLHTAGYLKPHRTEEFAKTSVMITNMAQNSGGSGVILESHPTESYVLTNKHVCGVAEQGGFVIREDKHYLITGMKKATSHDLCEIKVNADLGVNTKVAEHAPKQYSDAYISGHPALFPHVLTKGSFSGRMTIEVMTGMRPCTEQDFKDPGKGLYCLFMGGLPIVETYDSQLVTGTILPGSSGSAVFDENGEIAGLVFASRSRELSYAFVVPQEYVWQFTHDEAPKMDWQKPAKKDEAPSEESSSKPKSAILPRRLWLKI